MKHLILRHFPSIRIKAPKLLITVFALLSGFSLYAQNHISGEYNSLSVFSNPLFLVLLSVIILLMLVIIVLGNVLTGVAEATKEKTRSGKTVAVITTLFLMGAAKHGFPQSGSTLSSQGIPSMNSGLLYLMLSAIALEILIIIVLLNAIQLFIRKEKEITKPEVQKISILEKLNASVAIEKEEEIMFDHVYDGIRELDNDLPPWWKYGFYLTIVFAIAYLINYHVTSTGDLQIAEYNKSMLVARIAKEEFEKNNANNVNETTAEMLTDKAELTKGENIFKENCFACHGKFGEGGVGPNLTDDYWLHGGSIKDIFSSIKYGWADKGMKSWQADLSPVQIHEVASYIKTLYNTHPANAKEKQGDLYIEAKSAADSLKKDSANVSLPIKDSLNGNGK
jgi:cytochrome c oxidase cbb3-type subunit 3